MWKNKVVCAGLVAVTLLLAASRELRAEGRATGGFAGSVNLNAATPAELEELPGVGPSKAEAIVAFRKARGGFKKVEDLMKVRGIGRKTFLKLKPYLTVSGPGLSKPREAALGDGGAQGGRGRASAK